MSPPSRCNLLDPMRLGKVTALTLGLAAGLASATPAAAAPPVLTAVGHDRQHPWARWTLPAGVEARVVEVATAPDVGSNGYFWEENVEVFETLEPSQTYWLSTEKLDAGKTYYVHIGGHDEQCYEDERCPLREFSRVMTLTIPPPPPPARSPTADERKGITAALRRWMPPRFRPRTVIRGIRVSTRGPWAVASVVPKPRWRRLIQTEQFALRLIAPARWRVYFLRVSCPPPGMSRQIQRVLGIVCY